MAKDEKGRELQKHTLHLFAGQYDRLAALFPNVPPAKVIRHMVDDLCKRTEGEKPDVDFDL